MTISESQLMDLSARREAMQDDVINRLMERVDALNEQLRILREENNRLKAELGKVVKCKDCRYAEDYYHDGSIYCCLPGKPMRWHDDDPNWYCADGKRKETAGK